MIEKIATAVVVTAILSLGASPAWASTADSTGSDEVCWLAVETAQLQCFADEESMKDAIFEQTGAVLVEEGTQLGRSSLLAAAAVYPISRMFENTNYGGSYLTVTAPSTTFCVNSSISLSNIGATWNDRVSSVRSYNGCLTRLWSNINYTGTVGTYNDATSLGGMNDAASSYKIY